MRTISFNLKVLALVVLSLIPWPGPTVFKISCPRDHASVVRKLVQKKWVPVLEKYQVQIPVECPFHPVRDIYWPQQSAKQQHRPSQWTCGICGKSFYEERFLDMHFDNRHKNQINMAEDAVCLADYCDIMRCEVLMSQEVGSPIMGDQTHINTDIEIWSEATAYRTALSPSGPRDLARVLLRGGLFPSERQSQAPPTQPRPYHCPRTTAPDTPNVPNQPMQPPNDENNATGDMCDNSNLVDSVLPPVDYKQQRLSELQKLKANCKPEELQKLKLRCEVLVRDCIAGLLVNLSIQDFKEVEEELNRAVCWYLTCDRYWEDTPGETRHFPWGLVFVLIMVLSLGICLCYYIIWVLFDSDDMSVASTSTTATATSSPVHHVNSTSSGPCYSEEYYTVPDLNDMGQNEHYIYVTYPPELKRRLLERFLGTAPEIRLMSWTNFVPFLFFQLYSIFLKIFFSMETFLDLVSDLSNEEIAAMLQMYIRHKRHYCNMCIIVIVISILSPFLNRPRKKWPLYNITYSAQKASWKWKGLLETEQGCRVAVKPPEVYFSRATPERTVPRISDKTSCVPAYVLVISFMLLVVDIVRW